MISEFYDAMARKAWAESILFGLSEEDAEKAAALARERARELTEQAVRRLVYGTCCLILEMKPNAVVLGRWRPARRRFLVMEVPARETPDLWLKDIAEACQILER